MPTDPSENQKDSRYLMLKVRNSAEIWRVLHRGKTAPPLNALAEEEVVGGIFEGVKELQAGLTKKSHHGANVPHRLIFFFRRRFFPERKNENAGGRAESTKKGLENSERVFDGVVRVRFAPPNRVESFGFEAEKSEIFLCLLDRITQTGQRTFYFFVREEDFSTDGYEVVKKGNGIFKTRGAKVLGGHGNRVKGNAV